MLKLSPDGKIKILLKIKVPEEQKTKAKVS